MTSPVCLFKRFPRTSAWHNTSSEMHEKGQWGADPLGELFYRRNGSVPLLLMGLDKRSYNLAFRAHEGVEHSHIAEHHTALAVQLQ